MALWGDGRPSVQDQYGKTGDLAHYDPATLDRKFRDYVGDYLNARYFAAHALVLERQPWPVIRQAFAGLPMDVTVLAEARQGLPNPAWLGDELFMRMQAFLGLWWGRLAAYFAGEPDATHLLDLLRERLRQRDRVKRAGG
jgi:hypothetical protein